MLCVLLGVQWNIDWSALSDPWIRRAAKVLAICAFGAAVYGAGMVFFGFRPRDLRPPKDRAEFSLA